MELKRAKVVMLPTEEIASGVKLIWAYPHMMNELRYSAHKEMKKEIGHYLYFTTDEEIKEGDKIINLEINRIFDAPYNMSSSSKIRKIIATNDPKLTSQETIKVGDKVNSDKQDFNEQIVSTENSAGLYNRSNHYFKRLPQPSKAFIEKYCKLGGIDEVDVEMITAGTWVEEKTSERIGQRCTTCNEYEYGGSSECECGTKLKVDSHNTITIHPIEEQMYSREEVERLIWKAVVSSGGRKQDLGMKWIKENL